MFRYLIYRTDFGDTIIRESATSSATGGTELELLSDFVIPINQPLYLWRVTGGTDVVPNLETNVNAWFLYENPPSPDDNVTYGALTGYTAQTQTSLDGKINTVTGFSGNVPVFDITGNLVDSGYTPNDFLNGSTGGTSIELFTGYTATTEIRLSGIEDDIVYLSGQTDTKLDITDFNSYTGVTETRLDGIEDDIVYLSGQTDTKLDITDFNVYSGATDTRLDGIEDDITYLSGQTAGKLDASDFNSYTATTETRLDGIEDDIVYLSGQTAGKLNITDFNVYSADTKTYIDSVAAGLDPKASVRVATTTSLTGATYVATGGTATTGSFTSAPTVIDGITLVDGDRILVKNQTDPRQNGIYIRISAGVWFRSLDMNGTPVAEVSSGAFTFVETGNTLASTGWVVGGDGILDLNVDPIVWTQFSAANSYIAGVGITINGNTIALDGAGIAGNNIDWSGSQLNLQITGGTLGPALDAKVDDSLFNTYTGNTETRLGGIEDDIIYLSGQTDTKLDITDFNSYTATTETRLDGIEDDILALSAITSGLTGQYVEISLFTGYTATTETRLDGIESDIVYLSGQTDTKLDTIIFTGYTASTKSDEIHLIRTGSTGIDINTITPTAIVWNGQLKTSTVFSWTGGSGIFVNQTGDYEITYNIPIVQTGSNNARSYGSNIVVDNATIINRTFAGENTSRADAIGNLALPSVVVSLTSGTRLDLLGFRAGLAGTTNTRPDATILIKKKNTLQ